MASRFSAAHVWEAGGRRYRYRYRAVTAGGCGVHSIDYVSLWACRKRVDAIKGTWPDAEVQRVRQLLRGDDPYAYQYELEYGGRWVPESKATLLREGVGVQK